MDPTHAAAVRGFAVCAQVLKGVIRVEKIEDPVEYAHMVIKRVKRGYIEKLYTCADRHGHHPSKRKGQGRCLVAR